MDTTSHDQPRSKRQRALGFAKRAHFDKELAMHVNFASRETGPERLVCEAELVFDEIGPLAGLRLVGFTLWRGNDGEIYVTFPSRAFGVGADRRFFDYVRGEADDVKRFKAFVLEAFKAQGVAPAPAPANNVTERRSAKRTN